MARACSARTSIFASWRRISGRVTIGAPKAMRRCAMNSASVTARRIMPAARTPFDRRELFTMSAIWRMPAPASPTIQAVAPSSLISPLAMERVPSFSFSRTMR